MKTLILSGYTRQFYCLGNRVETGIGHRRPDELWCGSHYAVIQDGEVFLRAVPYPTETLHREVIAANVCQREKDVTVPWWFP